MSVQATVVGADGGLRECPSRQHCRCHHRRDRIVLRLLVVTLCYDEGSQEDWMPVQRGQCLQTLCGGATVLEGMGLCGRAGAP